MKRGDSVLVYMTANAQPVFGLVLEPRSEMCPSAARVRVSGHPYEGVLIPLTNVSESKESPDADE